MRPGATVVIKQDQGSELVQISMLHPTYPTGLLQQQIGKLGVELGVPPRGIMVFVQKYGDTETQKLVKAQFAINGLMNTMRGETNLQAVARMFAGVPAPYTIHMIQVILDGETPQERTLNAYANDGIVVSGTANTNPNTIDYLIQLRTQDPTKITIPRSHIADEPVKPQPKGVGGFNTNLLMVLIVLASIAAGALVYFVMLGRTVSR